MPLPPYNHANSVPLSGTPPFTFPGVTLRMFPLKADMYVLRSFCNQLVNIAPHEVAEFEPFVPFVYLTVIHYGRMATAATNLGWVSQHEVTFSIPLMHYRRRNGRREFIGFVSLTPFMFVDNELSLTTGREVYGWPKVFARLDGGVERWLDDPTSPQTLMSLSTDVLISTGAHTSMKPLIEIENWEVRNIPFGSLSLDPWIRAASTLPRAALGALSLGADLMEIWAAPPFLGYSPGDRALLAQGLLEGFQRGLPLRRSPYWDILTLKQFRDAVHPEDACYQALIRSRMGVGRFNGGGLMGGTAYLQGDPSGGYRIKIYDYASQPMVGSFGLEVEDHVSAGGIAFDVLRPVCPFWIGMDLRYGRGKPICWRASSSSWHAGGRVFPPRSNSPLQGPGILFNTAQGLSNPEVPGPFEMNDGEIHVLPLAARPGRLRDFVSEYLDLPRELGWFEPYQDIVYLAVGAYGLVSSRSQPMGSLSCRTAAFFIPVLWHRPDGSSQFVLVPPFLFADNQVVSITSQEESGLPVLQASLTGPPDFWLRSPSQLRPLMSIRLLLFPVLNLGAQAEERVLVGIAAGPLPQEAVPSPEYGPMEAEWVRKAEEAAKSSKPFQGPGPGEKCMRSVTLKQIRDSWDPNQACFQEYLLSENRVRFSSPEYVKERVHVWIYRYPSIPIVQKLGLIVEKQGPGVPWGGSQGAGFDILQPIQPFHFEGSLEGLWTRSICWRAGSEHWRRSPPHPPPYVGPPGKTPVGHGPVVPPPGEGEDGRV